MKYSFLKFILVLSIITASHAASNRYRHRDEDESGRPDRETHQVNSKLSTIDRNVAKLIEMVTSGFTMMNKKLNNLYELIPSKTAKIPANQFEDSNVFLNITNSDFNNYTDKDEIDFFACGSFNKNGSTGLSSYRQVGPSGDDLQEMDSISAETQANLKSINLVNLKIDNEVLLKSLQFSCNLEDLTLINVNLTFSNSSSSNLTDREIFLPKLKKYVVEFNGESRKLDETQIFPFIKNGSKWNTDITYKNHPKSSIGLRIIPETGRIESNYIGFNEKILSNLEPDFDLKELLVMMGSLISIGDIPSTLKLLSLQWTDYGSIALAQILRNSTELQHFQFQPFSGDISINLADLPETIESLSLDDTRLQYSPDVKFTKLERLNLNIDSSMLDPEIINNVENIFPNLKTVVLFKGGPIFEKILNMPNVKQFVSFRSKLTDANHEVKGCRTTWCSVLRDTAGTTVNMNVDDVGLLIDSIFPEFKTYFN